MKARFRNLTIPVTIEDEVATLHLTKLNLEIPISAFEEMMVEQGTIEPTEILAWDCGCGKLGEVFVPAGLVTDAVELKWTLTTAAQQYGVRAMSDASIYSSAKHPKLIEGIFHVADQLVKRQVLDHNPFRG